MKRLKYQRRKPHPVKQQAAKILTGKAVVPVMPMHLPNDPHVVTFLLNESERISALGNKWMVAKTPNHIAGNLALQQGWAHALSAAWLRCKLNGELDEPRKKRSSRR